METTLKQLIGDLGLTQAGLARVTGISKAAVSALVNHGQWPKRNAAALREKIADALACHDASERRIDRALSAPVSRDALPGGISGRADAFQSNLNASERLGEPSAAHAAPRFSPLAPPGRGAGVRGASPKPQKMAPDAPTSEAVALTPSPSPASGRGEPSEKENPLMLHPPQSLSEAARKAFGLFANPFAGEAIRQVFNKINVLKLIFCFVLHCELH